VPLLLLAIAGMGLIPTSAEAAGFGSRTLRQGSSGPT
jgi:hypothetical protein